MKGGRWRAYVTGACVLVLLGLIFSRKVHFDWAALWYQLRAVDLRRIALGVAFIYVSVSLRAVRWALLLRPTKKRIPIQILVGPQFIGFASVALFGSLADLVRPYLIAKRLHISLSSQIATYMIERMYDLGAAAVIFLGALALSPERSTLPHREVFMRVGLGSFLAATAICIFAVSVHRFGSWIARQVQRSLQRLSRRASEGAASRVLLFREGLNTVSSMSGIIGTLLLSLVIWGFVGLACVQVVHAFTQVEQLARLSFLGTMLLLAASIGGSLVQLPLVGWFTQIAATAGTMHTVLNVPTEPAAACGALLLAVTFLCILPAGLLFAHLESVSMRKVVDAIGDDVADTAVSVQ